MPLSTLVAPASHQCVAVMLTGLGMRQSGFRSYTCCSGSGTLGKLLISLSFSCLISKMGIFNTGPQRRQWHPTPVLLPGKSHGWRSLVGCSPWGLKESDMTERLHFHFSLSFTGEGNGNPFQCSCLENPRDGATWWAAV